MMETNYFTRVLYFLNSGEETKRVAEMLKHTKNNNIASSCNNQVLVNVFQSAVREKRERQNMFNKEVS